jgi:hypothetical protein
VIQLKASAIAGEISVEDLRAELLHVLRSSRPNVGFLGKTVPSAPSDRSTGRG